MNESDLSAEIFNISFLTHYLIRQPKVFNLKKCTIRWSPVWYSAVHYYPNSQCLFSSVFLCC